LAFVTAASPVGILAMAVPAGIVAIALGTAEVRRAAKRSRSRRLAGAGIAFTLLGFGLAVAWIYASFAFASAFGGSPRVDVGRLLCTACQVLSSPREPDQEATPRPVPVRTSAPSGRQAAGWLLILSKDDRGRVLTAEAVNVPAGSRDFRIG
jgi:hypothetical protein